MRRPLSYKLYLPLLLVILMAGVLVACGSAEEPTQAPAPTAAPAATTAPAPTAAPTATTAPAEPTATPSGPSPTARVIPTVAPTEAVEEGSKTWPDAYPKAGENGIPADVGKFTVAMDSWGASDLNPWGLTSVSFLHDYYTCA